MQAAIDSNSGTKRKPAPPAAAPPSKRAAVASASRPAAQEETEEQDEDGAADADDQMYDEAEELAQMQEDEEPVEPAVELPPPVAKKVQLLEKRGLSIEDDVLNELASAEQRDALVVLEALSMRDSVQNPSNFVRASLKKRADMRAAKAGAAAPSSTVAGKPQAAKPAVAKTPVAKAPVAKAPVAKAPVAKAAVAKTGPAKPPSTEASSGPRIPPRLRSDLDFEQKAVQAKLVALNKLGLWQGQHPLDNSSLTALLSVAPARALEILDEAEELGGKVPDPVKFVLNLVEEERDR